MEHRSTDPGPHVELTAEIEEFRKRLDQLRSEYEGTADTELLLAELETAHEELRVADEEVRSQQEELQSLAALQRTERWLHDRVVAMLPVPVLVTDGAGVIRSLNASAVALLRLRLDRVMGKPFFSFVDPSDRPGLRQMLVRAVHSGGSFHRVTTLRARESGAIEVELAATVVRDEHSGSTRATWVCLRAGLDQPGDAAAPESARITECLVELTSQSLAAGDPATVLSGVTETCRRAFPMQTWVSVTVGPPSEPELLASDSKVAQEVDGAQLRAGEGPCQSAWEQGATVTTSKLSADGRWPRFAQAEGTGPVTAVVAVPVSVGESRLGVLNVYAADSALVADTHVRAAELFAATIGALLQETDTKRELAQVASQLQEAMRSRATIEQAKGMLMASRGCSPDEAFQLLAQLSSRTNVKLRAIAEQMVQRAVAAPTPPSPQVRTSGR